MFQELCQKFEKLPQVEAIALGGSRASGNTDPKSDYDIYIYCNNKIDEDFRKEFYQKYCSIIEVGNHYFEYEDNCVFKDKTAIDIIFRELPFFEKVVSYCVEKHYARNGYTTCFWHNLKTCEILFDKNGKLQELKNRFDIPYPPELKKNIIEKNLNLLSGVLPSYDKQILKAVQRNDLVSINHRITAFIESYFDIIFALNELTHPGEKKLIEICKRDCQILPKNFEENLKNLFDTMFSAPEKIEEALSEIIKEIKILC